MELRILKPVALLRSIDVDICRWLFIGLLLEPIGPRLALESLELRRQVREIR